jgi:hypothetical protein
VFSNIIYATEFVTNIYAGLPTGYTEITGTFSDCATDDARHANPSNSIYRFTNGSWSPAINVDDVYAARYSDIRKCNVFFKYIDLVKTTDHGRDILINTIPAATQKERLKGEVLFLRAHAYFELLKRYGGVPVVPDVPLTLNDNINLPKNTFDEVVTKIIKDCDLAIALLPATYIGTTYENYYGRATRWTVQALKARVLLYAASQLNNASNDRTKWVAAFTAAEPFFNGTAPFNLAAGIAGYEGLFKGNTATNTEIIWSRPSTVNSVVETANYPVGETNGNGGVNPSQYLVDAYEMSNGRPITDPASGYDPANPYANRDPRFAVSILYNGRPFKTRTIETFTGGMDGPQKVNGSLTGYYMRKHIEPTLDLALSQTAQHNWIYFRLAEMLLNYAEARNEADGPVADVYTAVNRVRARANMPALPAGLTQPQMQDRIRNERRIELAFEGHRFWDARRWNIATTVFNRKMRGMKVEKVGAVFTYTPYDLETMVFTAKMNRYPFLLSEIQANPNLQQNTGW